MTGWAVNFHVLAYSTGEGAEKDRQKVGGLRQTFHVEADDFDTAVKLAQHIARGIRSNPMVWQVHILGVESKEIR